MNRPFVIAVALLSLAACADRPGAGGDMSGDAPARFHFRADDQEAQALAAAAEDGRPVKWSVSSSSFGSVVPAATLYTDRAGRPCRAMRQERSCDGETRVRDVTACRGSDGTWVVSGHAPEKAD
jgi:surface antigen